MTFDEFWKRQQYSDDHDDMKFAQAIWNAAKVETENKWYPYWQIMEAYHHASLEFTNEWLEAAREKRIELIRKGGE